MMRLALVVLLASAVSAQDALRVALHAPPVLDPTHAAGAEAGRLVGALFEGLTFVDPKTERAVPGVAER